MSDMFDDYDKHYHLIEEVASTNWGTHRENIQPLDTIDISKLNKKLWSDGKCPTTLVDNIPRGYQDIVFNLLEDITCLQEELQELKNNVRS